MRQDVNLFLHGDLLRALPLLAGMPEGVFSEVSDTILLEACRQASESALPRVTRAAACQGSRVPVPSGR